MLRVWHDSMAAVSRKNNEAQPPQRLARRRLMPSPYLVTTDLEKRNAIEIPPRGDNPGPRSLVESDFSSSHNTESTSSIAVNNQDYILPVAFFVTFFFVFIIVTSFIVFSLRRRARNRRRNSVPQTHELERGTVQRRRPTSAYERLGDFIVNGGAVGAGAWKKDDAEALRKEAARRAQALRKGSTPRSSRQPSEAPQISVTPPAVTRSVMSFEQLPSMNGELLLPPPVYKADDPLQKRESGHRPEKLPCYREE